MLILNYLKFILQLNIFYLFGKFKRHEFTFINIKKKNNLFSIVIN